MAGQFSGGRSPGAQARQAESMCFHRKVLILRENGPLIAWRKMRPFPSLRVLSPSVSLPNETLTLSTSGPLVGTCERAPPFSFIIWSSAQPPCSIFYWSHLSILTLASLKSWCCPHPALPIEPSFNSPDYKTRLCTQDLLGQEHKACIQMRGEDPPHTCCRIHLTCPQKKCPVCNLQGPNFSVSETASFSYPVSTLPPRKIKWVDVPFHLQGRLFFPLLCHEVSPHTGFSASF